MAHPAMNPRFDIQTQSDIALFAKTLWLAASANHEACHDPDSRSVIPVRSEREVNELARTVIDYAHNAFRLSVCREGDVLTWPNGATLEFSVVGRTPVRGLRPSIVVVDELREIGCGSMAPDQLK